MQISKGKKIKLILLFNKGLITGEQLKTVLKFGFPAPAIFENVTPTDRAKELLSVEPIYKMLGEKMFKITCKND